MKRTSTFLLSLLFLLTSQVSKADEGMWIPALLTDNYAEMKRLGLEMTPEQLYSINNSSMKDAIVRLVDPNGRMFCTGEIISDKGLFLTNHHCGYGAIQSLSTTDANHLKNGFWAASNKDELPANFGIQFLVRIDEITTEILDGVTDEMTFSERTAAVRAKSAEIRKSLSSEGKYVVEVKEMFSGNKYFAYIYESFKDVRLVGTPPEAVGKYGGDTDNWMWPRHTGDFSMFRVYADSDNNAAAYAENNVPYKPKHHLPVSTKGVSQGDFAMIWGFPGSTDRYLTSYGVKLATDKDQPARVKLRRAKLDVYEKYQNQSEAVDLMYASKHARVSNYWKYFIGQTRGLKRLGVYEKKQAEEAAFMDWVNAGDQARKDKFGNVINLYKEAYSVIEKSTLPETYFMEAIAGIEFLRYGFTYARLESVMKSLKEHDYMSSMNSQQANIHALTLTYLNTQLSDESRKTAFEELKKQGGETMKDATFEDGRAAVKALQNENIQGSRAGLEQTRDALLNALRGGMEGAFKDYYMPIDKEVTKAMFSYYISDIAPDQRPAEFNDLLNKFNGNINAMVNEVFSKSMLVDKEKVAAFLNKPKYGKLKRDKGVELSAMFLNYYLNTIQSSFGESRNQRATADRLYKAALFQMYPDKKFAPNANGSMRFTYGQVLEYSPGDAMLYKHFTTMKGVLEKYQPGDGEFDLPADYLAKAREGDWGPYAKPGEDLRICFLTNHDITGGNSGSPVINGKGELIGLAFDGNWEAMSGDIAFETELQRTISVDIRYVLWCIDKLAGAGHIVDELTLVN
ncbi:MAG: S46 family peptidase [Bacteroidia bacterium]